MRRAEYHNWREGFFGAALIPKQAQERLKLFQADFLGHDFAIQSVDVRSAMASDPSGRRGLGKP